MKQFSWKQCPVEVEDALHPNDYIQWKLWKCFTFLRMCHHALLFLRMICSLEALARQLEKVLSDCDRVDLFHLPEKENSACCKHYAGGFFSPLKCSIKKFLRFQEVPDLWPFLCTDARSKREDICLFHWGNIPYHHFLCRTAISHNTQGRGRRLGVGRTPPVQLVAKLHQCIGEGMLQQINTKHGYSLLRAAERVGGYSRTA